MANLATRKRNRKDKNLQQSGTNVKEVMAQHEMSIEEQKARLQQINSLCVLSYTLSDVINTCLMDAEDLVKPFGMSIASQERHGYEKFRDALNKSRRVIRGFIERHLYESNEADELCQVSDDLYDILKLIIDHTNDTNGIKKLKNDIARRKHNNHIFDISFLSSPAWNETTKRKSTSK